MTNTYMPIYLPLYPAAATPGRTNVAIRRAQQKGQRGGNHYKLKTWLRQPCALHLMGARKHMSE
eukprot:4330851-Heterocapsa_arctica.AAC.1